MTIQPRIARPNARPTTVPRIPISSALDDGVAQDAAGRHAEGEHGRVLAAPFLGGDAHRVDGDQDGEEERDGLCDAEDGEELVHVAADCVRDGRARLDGGDAGDREEGACERVRAAAGAELDGVRRAGEAEEAGLAARHVGEAAEWVGVQRDDL